MAFPTTNWSLLAQASVHGGVAEREAMAEFFLRYRAPVVAFIARVRPGRDDAEDLAQGFFLAAMEDSLVRRAERGRGRFRSFLIGALLRHLGREEARAAAQKRGGGAVPAALEAEGVAEAIAVPPEVERIFDEEWALALLARVRAGVVASREARLGAGVGVLLQFLPGAVETPSYEDAAQRLGWPVARLKTEVFRLREDFRAAVRAEVALTVDSPAAVEAELAALRAALAGVKA